MDYDGVCIQSSAVLSSQTWPAAGLFSQCKLCTSSSGIELEPVPHRRAMDGLIHAAAFSACGDISCLQSAMEKMTTFALSQVYSSTGEADIDEDMISYAW